MAVDVIPVSSRLALKLRTGTDTEGNPVFRTRSYSSVKPSAADQDVYDTAQALAGLQQFPVEEISRVNENSMSQS